MDHKNPYEGLDPFLDLSIFFVDDEVLNEWTLNASLAAVKNSW